MSGLWRNRADQPRCAVSAGCGCAVSRVQWFPVCKRGMGDRLWKQTGKPLFPAGIDGDGCKYRFAGNRGFKGCASAAGSAQKSARTFFGECDQSRGDEQKFMEVKKYHSVAILLGQYVAVQIFLHYSTGNLSESGAMADCSRQNRIPKIMDGGFGILKCVRKNIMEKRKLPFGRMSLNWRLCFRNE